MAKRGLGYRDYFSQSASSSVACTVSASAAATDADEYGFYPDAPAAPSLSTPRAHMQNLDLNSQVDGFPFLDSYSGLLQSEGGRGEQAPAGHVARSGHGAFQPPRPAGGGGTSGRGGHPAGRRSRSAGTGSVPQVGVPEMGGGGRAPLMANRSARGATSAIPQFVGAHDGIEGEDDSVPQSNRYDKANWTNENNTYVFCELAVEQIRAGERPNGQMTARGYKEIQRKFREKTGLNHEIRQFKNRWTQCRSMWTFHEMTLNDTGLGRNANGTIIADDDWWNKHTKKRPECKKFKWAIPAYIDFLREMYQGWTVDGRSSCIPGVHADGDGDEDADGDEDREETDQDASPMSTSSRKRGSSSTTSTAKSPSKKQKNPMLKAMKGLIDTIQAGNTLEQNNLRMANEQKKMEQEQADQEIRTCLRMAKECGATEETDEYYAATQLFEKKYNRTVFCEFSTSEGRLRWLRRFCQNE